MSYRRGYLTIGCVTCSWLITDELPVPPIITTHTARAELPGVCNDFLLTSVRTVDCRLCMFCHGPLETTIHPEKPRFTTETMVDHLNITHRCQSCESTFGQFVGWAVVHHPVVEHFPYEHDLDVGTTPVWELYARWMARPHAEVLEWEPLTVSTWIDLAGDRLELTLDEHFDVVTHERR